MFLNVLMASAMSSHFSVHDEDILKHMNGKCHFVYTFVNL